MKMMKIEFDGFDIKNVELKNIKENEIKINGKMEILNNVKIFELDDNNYIFIGKTFEDILNVIFEGFDEYNEIVSIMNDFNRFLKLNINIENYIKRLFPESII